MQILHEDTWQRRLQLLNRSNSLPIRANNEKVTLMCVSSPTEYAWQQQIFYDINHYFRSSSVLLEGLMENRKIYFGEKLPLWVAKNNILLLCAKILARILCLYLMGANGARPGFLSVRLTTVNRTRKIASKNF